ncbi:MAG TPA: hypothetical protein VFZ58_01725 [Candidatus Saccharimonadales bacterium]
MPFSEEEALEATEQVLSGKIDRATLIGEWKPGDNPTHIVVAVALLIARGEDILPNSGGEYVLSRDKSYSSWLDELLAAGTGDQRSIPVAGRRVIAGLVNASRAIGMHYSIGKGGAIQIHLLPSLALVRLAKQYADNPAVTVYFQDAAAALLAEQRAAKEFRRRHGIDW